MNKFNQISFALCCSLTPSVLADQFDSVEQLYSLSLHELSQIQVVTAATGYTRKLDKAPATVTVIEEAEWQAKGALTLAQALQGIAGVQTGLLNSGNAESSISVRGLQGNYGQQVKVLIDGIAFNRIHNGARPGLEIPLFGFTRIEVLRNSGSVVYGADAFGGIINLVSKELNDDQQSELSMVAGAFDTYRLGLFSEHQWQDIKVNWALNYYHYGDDNERQIPSDLQSTFDQIFATNASQAPGVIDLGQKTISFNAKLNWQQLSLHYFILDGDFGPGVGIAQALDPDGRNDHRSQLISASYDLSKLNFKHLTLNAWYQKKQSYYPFTIFPAGSVLPIGSDGNLNFSTPTGVTLFSEGFIGHPGNESELFNISLSQHLTLDDTHNIRWELGYEKQNHHPYEAKNFGPGILNGTETEVDGTLTDVTHTPHVFLPYSTRNFQFFSVQDAWQLLPELTLHLGARYDDYSDVGDTLNPRLGLTWDINDWLDIRLFSGSAFRAPSFIGLYSKNNPVGLGNSKLEPEEITSHELSFDLQLSENLHTSLVLFNYRADKLVSYIPMVDVVGLTANNVGKLTGHGGEWLLRWRPTPGLDINANYSRLSSKDNNDIALPDYSEKMASLTVNYQFNQQLSANIFAQYHGKQQRHFSDNRNALPSYYWFSSRIHYQLNDSPLSVALIANNLTNEESAKYPSNGSIADDFPYPGRQWLVEMSYLF
ncbi:hypothetical protein tinsulaeT_05990 [Thalassotalea insulae]|uniref:TonB-dependent receptor n=1 Tax=Thalassotalea insulae TaxID=2056778 RepID=A0ABQ6GPZ9_9GAMM|nr:TonB-dependent receptor [Thalassotalea insulae]GLX77259.1 hypothetical protein tinsulaeT_05990 [Thalassotalea insulae]